MSDEAPITRRESEMRWRAHSELHGAHDKAHDQEHDMTAAALDKAVESMDRRLEGMNEFRASLKDQASTFARNDALDSLRERVIAIEKLDIKGEGKSLGQGAAVAAIIGTISVVGALLGIIVVVSNLLSTRGGT